MCAGAADGAASPDAATVNLLMNAYLASGRADAARRALALDDGLWPAQRGGVRWEHRMERFRRASVVGAIGSGAGAAGRAHLGSAGPAAAAPEAAALGEPEPEPEPPLTRAERRGEVI